MLFFLKKTCFRFVGPKPSGNVSYVSGLFGIINYSAVDSPTTSGPREVLAIIEKLLILIEIN